MIQFSGEGQITLGGFFPGSCVGEIVFNDRRGAELETLALDDNIIIGNPINAVANGLDITGNNGGGNTDSLAVIDTNTAAEECAVIYGHPVDNIASQKRQLLVMVN